MRRALAFLVAVAASAVMPGMARERSDGPATQLSNTGVLEGRVGSTKDDGEVIPAESATVYIFFSQSREDLVWTPPGHPAPKPLVGDVFDTAGGQYAVHLNGLLDRNKQLKALEKAARHKPRPEPEAANQIADQIAAYYLQSVDDSLAWIRTWLAKHPDRSWQVRIVTPDARGFWSAPGLQFGGYLVEVRGKLSGLDADWEGEVTVAPDRTVFVGLTRARFFRLQIASSSLPTR